MDALAPIEAKLSAHIVAASSATHCAGLAPPATHSVSAQLVWDGAAVELPSGSGAVADLQLRLAVRINAGTAEAARAAAQEIAELWRDAARFAELSALGVLSILPTALELPSAASTPTLCTARFAMRVRI